MLAAFLALPFLCYLNWTSSFENLRTGKPLIPYAVRKAVPWGLLDLAFFVIVVAVVTGGGVALASRAFGIETPEEGAELVPADQARVFFFFGTSTLISTAIGMIWLWMRYQRVDGFERNRLSDDLALGARWFAMLIVPVVIIQLILTRWMPTEHPLIEMLRESGDVTFLPVATFAAVISAPIFEEVFFRLLLQGWLEKLQMTTERIRVGTASKSDTDAVVFGGAVRADTAPHPPSVAESETHVEVANTTDRIAWVPILVTSALFALAHLGHGPDCIPLFFLAIGLGYLYQRTGRIQPCIVVHMLVNALGILQLWSRSDSHSWICDSRYNPAFLNRDGSDNHGLRIWNCRLWDDRQLSCKGDRRHQGGKRRRMLRRVPKIGTSLCGSQWLYCLRIVERHAQRPQGRHCHYLHAQRCAYGTGCGCSQSRQACDCGKAAGNYPQAV